MQQQVVGDALGEYQNNSAGQCRHNSVPASFGIVHHACEARVGVESIAVGMADMRSHT
jgi:hypothetical protein